METKYDKTSLERMLKSSDKDSVKLALSILRSNKEDFPEGEFKSLYYSVDVMTRIDTFEDICFEAGVTEESLIIFKNPKNRNEKNINALNKLFVITSVLNEGWFPDWNNDQKKYFVYLYKVSGSWSVYAALWGASAAYMASGLYFKNSKLANFSGNKFLNIYIDWIE